jgi:DNA (cytosine-5)-methyltransferase 1
MSKHRLGDSGFPIPVVDLFAGPGGLGEGFSAARDDLTFRIVLSVEKDPDAHKTLRLRAFQRQFTSGNRLPDELVSSIRERVTEDELSNRLAESYPAQWMDASQEANCLTLGLDNNEINRHISRQLGPNARNGQWVLIGGPPCQAYSLAGRARNSRARRLGIYKPEEDHRHFLYTEYLRIIAKHRPGVFVLENVKGMLSASVQGFSMFERILRDLRKPHSAFVSGSGGCSYRLYSVTAPHDAGMECPDAEDFIVKSERYGIPQRRHRVIIVGIRSDFEHDPSGFMLERGTAEIGCSRVIGDLPRLRSSVSRGSDDLERWLGVFRGSDWRRILAQGAKSIGTLARQDLVQRLNSYRDELLAENSRGATPGSPIQKLAHHARAGSRTDADLRNLLDWYTRSSRGQVFNHEARSHMASDLQRYFFASVYAKSGESATLAEFPEALLPNHRNVEASRSSRALFVDRFRVQLENEPSRTVTSHISKDGHSYIHYDPTQCRALTVREAARLQTFPDDYIFRGSRTSQFHQVGNAVPPFLAKQIAEAILRAMGVGVG